MKSSHLFFAQLALCAVPGRFASLFYQAHGQTPAQVGLILSLSSALVIPSTPFFCHIADRAKSREHVVAALYAAATVVFMLQIVALPSLALIDPAYRFPVLMVLAPLFSFFSIPCIPIVTAICIARLRELHGPDGHMRFGRERMSGAVSWGLVSLLLGVCLDSFNTAIIYLLYPVLSILFIITILRFHSINSRPADANRTVPSGASGQADEADEADALAGLSVHTREQHGARDQGTATVSFFEAARIVVLDGDLTNFSYFILLFTIFIGMMVVKNLQFLFFVNELAASNILCGITVIVTIIFEIPLFAVAPDLLRRFGATWLTIFAALTYSVRAIGYAFVPSAWAALVLEPLHGVTFAAVQTASVAYVAQRTPSGGDACVQGLVSLLRSAGGVVGTATGGVIMQAASGRLLYFCTGTLVLVSTLLFIARLLVSGEPEQEDGASEEDGEKTKLISYAVGGKDDGVASPVVA